MNSQKYTMRISLNVLNHLGINLYSNTPAVLAEVIANAWDAGAERVDIDVDFKAGHVAVIDDGCGMDVDDINKRYLSIGYQRREDGGQAPPRGRKPMGRKGIGKLSLFSIANKIHVQSRKGKSECALLMDATAIQNAIAQDNPEKASAYSPQSVDFEDALLVHKQGTAIKITDMKKRLTKVTEDGLRKRLARRFSVIGGSSGEFKVFLNRAQITYADRDYFHKARFLFQYGEEDFSVYCKKLEQVDGKPCVFTRPCAFTKEGKAHDSGAYKIKGWIGVAHHSYDLGGATGDAGDDENLNNIVVVVRGKVAQEDILHQYRKGGLITKFIYGEIQADFLDQDGKADIATSSRQTIIEDAPRYAALKAFIDKELDHIWAKTNKLKEKKGAENARAYPPINEWYKTLKPALKKKAEIFFGRIEQITADEKHRAMLFANGMLAFEKMKMQHTLDKLDHIDPDHIESVLSVFRDADEIEAAHYYEIVHGRLQVVKELKDMQKQDQKEQVFQKYVFDHLWLLDPAWERATSEAEMEKTIQDVIENQAGKGKKAISMRPDIRYRKVSVAHVVVELKRGSVHTSKTDLEKQIRKYMRAVKNKVTSLGEENPHIEGICIVGKQLNGWDDAAVKREEIESLRTLGIRVITYDELVNNAFSAYAKFIAKSAEMGKLRGWIQELQERSGMIFPDVHDKA